MEWTLVRKDCTGIRSIGELRIGNHLVCYTCEDAERQTKVPGQTAIPRGRYRVERTYSNRFQHETLQLLDVPNFEGIRIHAGNTAADTEGCILPGFERWINGVGSSRLAVAELDKWYDAAINNKEEVWITIEGFEPESWNQLAVMATPEGDL